MKNILTSLIVAGLLVSGIGVSAQESNDYAVKKVSDHIYELSYDAGGYMVKVIVSVGDDGILLVDSGHKEKDEALKAKLQELWQGLPKIIILTHEHIEHIGGNEIYGRSPVVIGHSSLRTRLTEGHFLFDEFTDATFPDIAFSDSMSVYFNGEEIRLISLAGGHSGSDIMVWFTKSNVACVGALCNWPHFPSIDEETGDVRKYPEDVNKVIELLPSDIKLISGHGEDCSMAELKKFHEMLVQTRNIVEAELAKGKTVETLEKEDVLKNFKSYEGGYTSANRWIEYLASSLQNKAKDTRKSLYEPMYYTLRDKGIDSAIAVYTMLKRDHADEYKFEETTPAIIGYLLFQRGKYPEAIRFFELGLKEYPEGAYTGVSYEYLGKTFEKTGDVGQALRNYKELLKLNPQDSVTAKTIKDLEKK